MSAVSQKRQDVKHKQEESTGLEQLPGMLTCDGDLVFEGSTP